MASEQGNAPLVARNSLISCVIKVQAQMRNQGSTGHQNTLSPYILFCLARLWNVG